MAATIFGLAAIAHSEVEVPWRAKCNFAFFEFFAILATLIFGFVQEETAPIGVCVVGDFLVQNVIYSRANIDILVVALSATTILEQAFKIVQILFQVVFLLLLNVFFLGVVQNDVQAVRSAKSFLFNWATACATGVGSGLVECPNVTAGKAIACNVGFF